jgi:lipopolysaccharide transport system ATP-binding protein
MPSDDIAISVRNLTKTYRLFGHPGDRIKQFLNFGLKQYHREFTALQDVSFDIWKGETIGIIGRNGSGKSTLLQLICGILKPSSGTVQANGQISALLELGAGFNPEFTGRENVYFQGALMGLTKMQMDERFDGIAAFAEIGAFIDQPVRTYSSGMFVRLAFATIAHVDANVLVIDEALAVGDALFTQKCMRYLMKFRERGTLLVVSHDANMISCLCDRVICLNKGNIQAIGPTKKVCNEYFASMFGSARPDANQSTAPNEATDMFLADQRRNFINASHLRNDLEVFHFDLSSVRPCSGKAQIVSVSLLDEEERPYGWVVGGEIVTLRILARTNAHLVAPILGFTVQDHLGRPLFADNTYLSYADQPMDSPPDSLLEASFAFQIPRLPVGDYSVTAAIAEGTQAHHEIHHWLPESLIFKARAGSLTGTLGLPMMDIKLKILADQENLK